MKTKWTEEEWMAGRIRRRRVADAVSPEDCGRATSRDDGELRAAFGGARNRAFASTEELARLSAAAESRLRGR